MDTIPDGEFLALFHRLNQYVRLGRVIKFNPTHTQHGACWLSVIRCLMRNATEIQEMNQRCRR